MILEIDPPELDMCAATRGGRGWICLQLVIPDEVLFRPICSVDGKRCRYAGNFLGCSCFIPHPEYVFQPSLHLPNCYRD